MIEAELTNTPMVKSLGSGGPAQSIARSVSKTELQHLDLVLIRLQSRISGSFHSHLEMGRLLMPCGTSALSNNLKPCARASSYCGFTNDSRTPKSEPTSRISCAATLHATAAPPHSSPQLLHSSQPVLASSFSAVVGDTACC